MFIAIFPSYNFSSESIYLRNLWSLSVHNFHIIGYGGNLFEGQKLCGAYLFQNETVKFFVCQCGENFK